MHTIQMYNHIIILFMYLFHWGTYIVHRTLYTYIHKCSAAAIQPCRNYRVSYNIIDHDNNSKSKSVQVRVLHYMTPED